ncbi:hypothetical protein ABZY09_13435 [Streptomyces sp. NPDC002928]|uniref:hypothetical protein n=1 Tax=Streptomyces sp. NPDC002928 TaxID=3154440 RepID=UPI0033A15DD1
MITSTAVYGLPGLSPFWTAIGLILVVEKTVSVRRAGPLAVLVAALMIPERSTMYGRVIGAGTTGADGATLAATGLWMNSMALLVAATTLVAAGVALFKLAPRPRRR